MVGSFRFKGRFILAAVFLTVLFLAPAAQGEAAIKYVTPGGAGSKNGNAWGSAMDASGFENGVKTAAPYTEYWLAGGYYPITHTLEPGHRISVYGGFAGNETSVEERDPAVNQTILLVSGNFRVMRVAAHFSVSVDGLFITGGNASTGGGGAVLVEGGATFTAAGCVFSDNQGGNGGAVFGENGSEFRADNCTFAGNKAVYGGALDAYYNSTFTATDCAFDKNEAEDDGGAVHVHNKSTFTAAGCTFDRNEAKRNGGAVALYGNSAFQAGNSSFHRNKAKYAGGAVYALSNSTFTGNSCTFDGNDAGDGGAFYEDGSTFTASNCTFEGNEADGFGGAANVNESTLIAVNCTFFGSTAREGGQAVYLQTSKTSFTAVNSIFWGDGGKKQIDRGSTVNTNNIRIAYCIIEGGYDPNEGIVNNIIDKDPKLGFLAKNGGPTKTMALLAGSPAIDAGTAVFTGVDIPGEDQRGVSRPRGSGYDIGAYEFEPSQGGGASGGSGGGCSSAGFDPPALLLLLPLAALLRGRR